MFWIPAGVYPLWAGMTVVVAGMIGGDMMKEMIKASGVEFGVRNEA